MDIIKKAIKEINEDLELKELENLNDETKIIELLDSVDILNLILAIEENLQKEYSNYIQVANEHIMDKDLSEFKTYKSLKEYIQRLIDESSI